MDVMMNEDNITNVVAQAEQDNIQISQWIFHEAPFLEAEKNITRDEFFFWSFPK